jgi:hypothetical protein
MVWRDFIAIPFQLCFSTVIRKVKENQERLELNGTHHLLVYADDVNMMSENAFTIKENAVAQLEASKGVVLDVNAEKTKFMVFTLQQFTDC